MEKQPKILKRKFKYSAFSLIFSAIVIASLIILNIVAGLFFERIDFQADITKSKYFEIEKGTKDYLEGIKDEVIIYIADTEENFIGYGEYYRQTNEIIKRFYGVGSNITLKYVNLDTNSRFNESVNQSIVNTADIIVQSKKTEKTRRIQPGEYLDIKYFSVGFDGSKQSQISELQAKQYESAGLAVIAEASGAAEQSLLSAIMTVVDDNPAKVGFDYSYGEGFVADTEGSYHSDALSTLLAKNAYELVDINLANGIIPDDLDFLIIYSPLTDFSDETAEKVDEFLRTPEKTVIYFAPTGAATLNTPVIDALLEKYGVKVEHKWLAQIDARYTFTNLAQVLNFNEYAQYAKDISSSLNLQYITKYQTRQVSILPHNTEDFTVTPLLLTYDNAISLDYSYDRNTVSDAFDAGAVLGIFNVATETNIEYNGGNTKLLVFGGGTSMTDEDVLKTTQLSNANFILNVFSEISGRDKTAQIIPKNFNDTNYASYTINSKTTNILRALLVYVLPIVVVFCGILIYARRKFK